MVEENELSKNANGGTELMLRRLHNTIDKNLLDKFQIIPSRVRELKQGVKRIFWAHDLPNDPEMSFLENPEKRKDFDKFVFVSNWQMQLSNIILGVPYRESIVIRNAIEPIGTAEEIEKKFKNLDTVRIIYHTTPHRGLHILYEVVNVLSGLFPNIHLDVFSSFGIYGWEERDKSYEELFDKIRNHSNMTYHGWKPNDVVREYVKNAHIFAYPSIWPETSCISLIEAMSAGAICIIPNFAALPETSLNFGIQYQFSEDKNEHANTFAQKLYNILKILKDENADSLIGHALHQKQVYDNYYNWDIVKSDWETLLHSLSDRI